MARAMALSEASATKSRPETRWRGRRRIRSGWRRTRARLQRASLRARDGRAQEVRRRLEDLSRRRRGDRTDGEEVSARELEEGLALDGRETEAHERVVDVERGCVSHADGGARIVHAPSREG